LPKVTRFKAEVVPEVLKGQLSSPSEKAGVKVTVRVVLPEILPNVAEMVEVPCATPVARPPLLIVAMDVLEEFQVTCAVRSFVVPSEYVPVAANCRVPPTAMLALAGVTDMAARGALRVARHIPDWVGFEYVPDIVLPSSLTVPVSDVVCPALKSNDKVIFMPLTVPVMVALLEPIAPVPEILLPVSVRVKKSGPSSVPPVFVWYKFQEPLTLASGRTGGAGTPLLLLSPPPPQPINTMDIIKHRDSGNTILVRLLVTIVSILSRGKGFTLPPFYA